MRLLLLGRAGLILLLGSGRLFVRAWLVRHLLFCERLGGFWKVFWFDWFVIHDTVAHLHEVVTLFGFVLVVKVSLVHIEELLLRRRSFDDRFVLQQLRVVVIVGALPRRRGLDLGATLLGS